MKLSELPEERKKKAYNLALQYIRESEDSLSGWVSQCLRAYQNWRGKLPSKLIKSGRSNIFFNKVFPLVETITPIEIAAILSQDPPIWVQPRDVDQVETAPLAERDLAYYQENSGQGLFMDLLQWDKSKVIYGVSVIKDAWVKHTRKVSVDEPVFITGDDGIQYPTGEIQKTERELLTYDGLFHRVIEPGHIIIAPGESDYIVNGRACRYCGDKSFYTDSYLKALQQSYRLENVDANLKGGTKFQDDWHNQKLTQIHSTERLKKTIKYNEMIELWFWFDINGDGVDEYCQMILINRQYPMAKFDVTPFKDEDNNPREDPPYVRLPHTVDPNEFISVGAVEPVEQLQVEHNVFRNMYVDNANLNINQMYKYRNNITPDQVIFTGGQGIPILEQDDIEFITPPPLNIDVDRRMRMEEKDFDEASGIGAWRMGVTSINANTAFEAGLVESAANAKAQLPLMITSKYALPRLAKLDLQNIIQFSEESFHIRLKDRPPQFMLSTPEQRQAYGKYDYQCTGYSTFSNKSMRIQQLLNFTDRILADRTGVFMEVVEPRELIKAIARLLFPDFWDVILKHPEAMQGMNELAQMAGITNLPDMGGLGGGGASNSPQINNEQELMSNLMRSMGQTRTSPEYGG